jgi:hypothetical protein
MQYNWRASDPWPSDPNEIVHMPYTELVFEKCIPHITISQIPDITTRLRIDHTVSIASHPSHKSITFFSFIPQVSETEIVENLFINLDLRSFKKESVEVETTVQNVAYYNCYKSLKILKEEKKNKTALYLSCPVKSVYVRFSDLRYNSLYHCKGLTHVTLGGYGTFPKLPDSVSHIDIIDMIPRRNQIYRERSCAMSNLYFPKKLQSITMDLNVFIPEIEKQIDDENAKRCILHEDKKVTNKQYTTKNPYLIHTYINIQQSDRSQVSHHYPFRGLKARLNTFKSIMTTLSLQDHRDKNRKSASVNTHRLDKARSRLGSETAMNRVLAIDHLRNSIGQFAGTGAIKRKKKGTKKKRN